MKMQDFDSARRFFPRAAAPYAQGVCIDTAWRVAEVRTCASNRPYPYGGAGDRRG
jgi:hypothetical protein